jgi:catechol 2,3-dioxygenase-like lactoylglutathione lyase family enzyme
MSESLASVGAITLFVEDVKQARDFYSEVFGAPVVYEDDNSAAFKFDNTIINLLAVTEAPGLIEPAPVAAAGTGSRVQFSVWVEDANAVCAQLKERGVELLNGPIDRPWGKRTATFADPAGHVWEIAEDI